MVRFEATGRDRREAIYNLREAMKARGVDVLALGVPPDLQGWQVDGGDIAIAASAPARMVRQ